MKTLTKTKVSHLLPGDIIGSGETVVNVMQRAILPGNKRQVVLINEAKGSRRVVVWGAWTTINVKREA